MWTLCERIYLVRCRISSQNKHFGSNIKYLVYRAMVLTRAVRSNTTPFTLLHTLYFSVWIYIFQFNDNQQLKATEAKSFPNIKHRK